MSNLFSLEKSKSFLSDFIFLMVSLTKGLSAEKGDSRLLQFYYFEFNEVLYKMRVNVEWRCFD